MKVFEALCLTICKAVLRVLEGCMQILCYSSMCKLEMEAFNLCFMALGIYLNSKNFFKRPFIFVNDREEWKFRLKKQQ